MKDTTDIVKLRVLLSFLKQDDTCTVTGISRTLKINKQTVSRTIMTLEKEGLIDRSDQRHPMLTTRGYEVAQWYENRIHTSMNHLMYEGVNIDSAKNDAYHWALFNSENTMDIIRSSEKMYRVKYELRDQQRFSGSLLCKLLDHGEYMQPFIIYREHVKDGSNISMANEGFEHPCTLSVKEGEGTIQLKAIDIIHRSGATNSMMRGKIKSLQYFDAGRYIGADRNGDVFTIPASALNFINIGEGMSQVLHGSVCCKMQCNVGILHMPESTAIFTILI